MSVERYLLVHTKHASELEASVYPIYLERHYPQVVSVEIVDIERIHDGDSSFYIVKPKPPLSDEEKAEIWPPA